MTDLPETSRHSRPVMRLIASHRWPLQDEKTLQAAFAAALERADLPFEREVALGGGDIIDFLIEDLGIELKLSGQRRQIWRQCSRYCAHARIGTLLLCSSAAMGLPDVIHGKRVHVASLGRGWL